MLDPWLSEILGYPVYNSWIPPESDERSLSYAKVPVDNVATVHVLTEVGFRVVSVEVTLKRSANPWGWALPGGSVYTGVSVWDEINTDALHKVLDIAKSCFRYSRFHLDPNIPDDLADKVKYEWVKSYFTGTRGSEFLVAWDQGSPSGFLAVLDDDGTKVIDLIGVAEDRQRQGVGSRLVQEFSERHRGDPLRVGTQIANAPSLAFYRKFFFTLVGSSYVLHLHRGAE